MPTKMKVVYVATGDLFDALDFTGIKKRYQLIGVNPPKEGEHGCHEAASELLALIGNTEVLVTVFLTGHYDGSVQHDGIAVTVEAPSGENVNDEMQRFVRELKLK